MKNVYEIPSFLYDKKIYNYLSSLTDLGFDCYNDFKEKQEECLAKIIIDSLENDVFDILDLEDDDLPMNKNNNEKILNHVYKNLQYDIDQLLLEIIENKENDTKRENGLVSFKDNQTGEVQWRRYL